MLKLVLVLLVVVLGLMFWFGKGRRPSGPSRASPGAMKMVACAHCGLNLPQTEALEGEGGRHYCGAEHRRLGPGAGGGG